MRVNAYILAADPAWIEASVGSYYHVVNTIVVSFDRSGRGWTAAPIRVNECLDRLRSIDRDGKMRFEPGDHAREGCSPMENDTDQRRRALGLAGEGADWVLAVNTDEILPDARSLVRRLAGEVPEDCEAVEWPMRPFFRQLGPGRFLEVCSRWRRRPISEYPGCVAVRAGTPLAISRHADARRWRFDVRPVGYDAVERQPYEVHGVIPPAEAILHLSWARSEADLLAKLASWSHNRDFDGLAYFERVWKPSPRRWWRTYDFHPVWPRRWPALRPTRLAIVGGPEGEVAP